MNVGDEIKYRRLKLKLTQQQLADMVGHSKAYVSDIERNRKKLSVDTLLPFIEAMGGKLSIEWQESKVFSKEFAEALRKYC